MENNKHPTFGNGKICYILIPATDIKTSASFYKEVFGWRIRENSDGELSFDDTVGEVSGMWVTGKPPSTTPGLMIHIMVDDAAVTVEAIAANGGSIVEPIDMDAPEITASFSDPAGNVLGIYQHRG